MARRTGGHIGWEAVTLRGIAEELAFGATEARVAGDLERQLLLNDSLAATLPDLDPSYAELATRPGFRTAIGDAVFELRIAGIGAEELRARVQAGTPAHAAALVLVRYEALLAERHLLDPAGLFLVALERFDAEAPYVLPDELHLAPQVAPRGLPRRLFDRLVARGTIPFELPPVAGTEPTQLFVATTPVAELRECFRRAVTAGAPLDAVELVCTDPDTYGVAFEALLQHLGLPGSTLQGVPWRRTLVGRAVGQWWRWLSDGLPADQLRSLLESGHLGPAPTRLFRELGIGWGRARYDEALAELGGHARSEALSSYDDEEPDHFAERKEDLSTDETTLGALLRRILATTPRVPERGGSNAAHLSVGALAEQTRGFLDLLVVDPESGEGHTATRLRNRLGTLVEGSDPGTVPFGMALAELMSALDDLRAWPGPLFARKPWSAQGGRPHLTDLAHAGTTGRPHCFVVGLDADRVAGPRLPDPILPDDIRLALGAERIATTSDRRADRRKLVRGMLARLGPHVTLSYARAGGDGRTAAPAPILLEEFRRVEAKPEGSYADLLTSLGAPASPVPGEGMLDRRDVWLGALGEGPVLRDGAGQLRASIPAIDRGLKAAATWTEAKVTPVQGAVTAAARALDPRVKGKPVSPSSLELLARCPRAFFYKNGLRLRSPEDPEYDPGRWLDPAQRGSLLHEVFEQFGRAWVERQSELGGDAARTSIREILGVRVASWRVDVPPPSELVFLSEERELRHAAEAFLAGERERQRRDPGRRWTHFELDFPKAGGTVGYPDTTKGAIPVRGRIDRVDTSSDGTLVVLDYKTGSPHSYKKEPKFGPFRGGRSLQPAIYAAATHQLLGAAVRAFEYLFPTAKGRNTVVRYEAAELAAAAPLIDRLLEHTVKGSFIPTNDANDCKYCDFRDACRVETPRFELGQHASPRAAWAKEHAESLREYAGMLARRTKE